MSKLAKMLQLINLLNRRQVVTLDMIRETCDLPERTAYRYLNRVSEADVPVYYDRELKGYCLSRSNNVNLDGMSMDEAVVLVVALTLLARRVNSKYADTIHKLTSKICVRQAFPVEKVTRIVDMVQADSDHSDDLSEFLSTILIQIAMQSNRRVSLEMKGMGAGEAACRMEEPSLQFKDDWWVVDHSEAGGRSTCLAEVDRVRLD
ncbi:MAG: hypothetical protein KKA42_07475 [candidate division Zixibacteria bacterium]|nr:hypothetical protein [candidate division Zixibacteria bacterium]